MLNLLTVAEKDFGVFYSAILQQKLARMHREIVDTIMTEKRNIVVMASRGHGKTQLLSIGFPLWICWRTPAAEPKMIIIQSASLDQSTEILRKIKSLVENNAILRERLLPDNIHQVKWSETQLELKNGHRIICTPFGDSVRGKHVDYCICDDVLKDETTNVEESKKTFYAAVWPITQAKKGKHIVVGTPMSFKDLLFELTTRETFRSLKYPAFKEDGTPQFPELFTVERLHDIKQTMPSHLWSREYLLLPVSDESALFPYESAIKPCIAQDYPALTKDEEASMRYVVGCDVAVSDAGKADFSCYMILKLVDGHPIYLHKKEYFKGVGTDAQISKIKELHKIYHFSKIVVEQTGLSYGIVDALSQDGNVAGVLEGFETKVKSKAELLGRLEVAMRNGNFKFLQDDALIDELAGWEIETKDGKQTTRSVKEHDDQVMALALAVYAASTVLGNGYMATVERPISDQTKQDVHTITPKDLTSSLELVDSPTPENSYPNVDSPGGYYNYG